MIVHDKYLPDIEIDTYLGLVLATQFYFCYSFLFTNLNVHVPIFMNECNRFYEGMVCFVLEETE